MSINPRRQLTTQQIAQMKYKDAAALMYILDTMPPPPCVLCPKWSLCAEEEIACQTFKTYVNVGKIWGRLPRVPTRAIYLSIYREDSDE